MRARGYKKLEFNVTRQEMAVSAYPSDALTRRRNAPCIPVAIEQRRQVQQSASKADVGFLGVDSKPTVHLQPLSTHWHRDVSPVLRWRSVHTMPWSIR